MDSVATSSKPKPFRDLGRRQQSICLRVQDEIWRVTAGAAQNQTPLCLPRAAKRIARQVPGSGFSLQSIEDAVVFAAIEAGVVVSRQPPAKRVARRDDTMLASLPQSRSSGVSPAEESAARSS